jgi:hypothetical protein
MTSTSENAQHANQSGMQYLRACVLGAHQTPFVRRSHDPDHLPT